MEECLLDGCLIVASDTELILSSKVKSGLEEGDRGGHGPQKGRSPIQLFHKISNYCNRNQIMHKIVITSFFFSPGATTPIGGCILQPSSGL